MERVRLAELCASTSLFTDLGTGQPVEHGLRACLVAMRLAEALDLGAVERREVLYVTLLRFLGCTADAHQAGAVADGDDILLFATAAPAAMGTGVEELVRMLSVVGRTGTVPHRLASVARILADPAGKDRLLTAHCEVAVRLGREMGMPPGVTAGLEVAYARWDGRGVPKGVGGDSIPISLQVAIVARDLELWARHSDSESASQVLTRRRGRAYAPAVVDAALREGVDRLRRPDRDLWSSILRSEPRPWMEVRGPDIRRALAALGDFADLKTPRGAGRSRRVARLVGEAARSLRLGPDAVEMLSRAGHVHDVGMVAVPVGELESATPLGPGGSEQLRMHPLWTQRLLSRCSDLAGVAALAGRHHERLDGTGYPAATAGWEPVTAGLLACAVLFEELTSHGPGHPGLKPELAAEEMTGMAAEGRLSFEDVKAVLDVLELVVPPLDVERPAGLTEREVDVLKLLAQGGTNRQIAAALGISPKTVGTHVEHIYAKTGVTTRPAATLFAVHNSLV